MGPKLAFLIHKTQKWQFAQVAITKKLTPTKSVGRGHATMQELYLSFWSLSSLVCDKSHQKFFIGISRVDGTVPDQDSRSGPRADPFQDIKSTQKLAHFG